MRRDRILQSAVAAALAMVPPLAHGKINPNTLQPEYQADTSIFNNTGLGTGPSQLMVSPNLTNAAWQGGFFTTSNQSTVVGSWSVAGDWSPAVVPGVGAESGGTATLGASGDRVGNFVFNNSNPTLGGLNVSNPTIDRIFSIPTGAGGSTSTISAPANGTLVINATQATWPQSPSFRGTQGLTGVQMFDLRFAGGANSTVVLDGVGSINLARNSSTNQNFIIKGSSNVFLWDHLTGVNGGGSPDTTTNDDSVFGTGSLTLDGGTVWEWDVAATPDDLQFNHPVHLGAGGGIIRPVTSTPTFNNVIDGPGKLVLGAFGDARFNANMTYSGDTVLDSGVFLHFVGSASALNTNFENRARLDFDCVEETGNHDRIGDTKSITMLGSGIQVNATSGGFDFAETWGSTNVNGGVNHFTIYPEIARDATLSMNALNFNGDGLLLVRGVNVGASVGTRSHVFVTGGAGVTLVGGGGSDGTKQISVSQNIYGFTGATIGDPDLGGAGSAGLMTYSAATGLRPLNLTTEYVTGIGASGNTADNVRTLTGEAVGAAKTINALVMHGSVDVDYSITGSPLTITSGVLLTALPSTTSVAGTVTTVTTHTATIPITSISERPARH